MPSFQFPRKESIHQLRETVNQLGGDYLKQAGISTIPPHRQALIDILTTTASKSKSSHKNTRYQQQQVVWLMGALLYVKYNIAESYALRNPENSALYKLISDMPLLQGINKECSEFALARFYEFYRSVAYTLDSNNELKAHMENPYAKISGLDVKQFEKNIVRLKGSAKPFSDKEQRRLHTLESAIEQLERTSARHQSEQASAAAASSQSASSFLGSVYHFFSSSPKARAEAVADEQQEAENSSAHVSQA